MIGWALTFLVVALVAAVLGFGGIAGTAIGIAKIIFFVAIVLFVLSLADLLAGAGVPRTPRGRGAPPARPPPPRPRRGPFPVARCDTREGMRRPRHPALDG